MSQEGGREARARSNRTRSRLNSSSASTTASASGLNWKQLGPYNIGGRVTDVVADRFTPNTAFAAVSGGGIWKTSDGGNTWASIWPDQNVQTMGAVAQASDGTLWAGTGEANPPGGGLTYFGNGVYKSIDGGKTWAASSTAFGSIVHNDWGTSMDRELVADPFVPDTFYVNFVTGGFWVTTDGGVTWTQRTSPGSGGTAGTFLCANPKVQNR